MPTNLTSSFGILYVTAIVATYFSSLYLYRLCYLHLLCYYSYPLCSLYFSTLHFWLIDYHCHYCLIAVLGLDFVFWID